MISLTLLMIAVAYLFGSLSSAVVISQLFGLPDPRTAGSKNPGATNVYRLGGRISDYHAALTEVGAIFCSANVHEGWNEVDSETGEIPIGDPTDQILTNSGQKRTFSGRKVFRAKK